jgi:hypothetical protein
MTVENNMRQAPRGDNSAKRILVFEKCIWVRKMERDVVNIARSRRPCHRSQVTTFTWRLYAITRPLILPVADLDLRAHESYWLSQKSDRLRDGRPVLDFQLGQSFSLPWLSDWLWIPPRLVFNEIFGFLPLELNNRGCDACTLTTK